MLGPRAPPCGALPSSDHDNQIINNQLRARLSINSCDGRLRREVHHRNRSETLPHRRSLITDSWFYPRRQFHDSGEGLWITMELLGRSRPAKLRHGAPRSGEAGWTDCGLMLLNDPDVISSGDWSDACVALGAAGVVRVSIVYAKGADSLFVSRPTANVNCCPYQTVVNRQKHPVQDTLG